MSSRLVVFGCGLWMLSLCANGQTWFAETVAKGLAHPWAVAFLPNGEFLVTERPGRLRVVGADGQLHEPISGLPAVQAGGQGGLLDLVLDADFGKNRTLFFCFSEAGLGGNSTALAKAKLSADRRHLEDVRVIFSQKPKVNSTVHFGCRIVLRPDATLYLALGERGSRLDDAQVLGNHLGKVVRLTLQGDVPKDNPFVGVAGVLPEIWSYGHRNPQGATLGPEGKLWILEHGPQGGDEVNVVLGGKNYGWPVITYGENYGGGKIGAGLNSKPGMEQPLHHWTPSIAPAGMAFVTSDRYGADTKGNLFVGSLKFGYVDRIEWYQGKVLREHRIPIGERVRDVRQGPDGYLYVLTDQPQGRLLRMVRR